MKSAPVFKKESNYKETIQRKTESKAEERDTT